MNNLKYFLLVFAFSFACPSFVFAEDDDDQSEIRENPEIENTTSLTRTVREYPKYINQAANHIDLNGDDWSVFAKYFNMLDSVPVNIVHIGDSHLQADMATAVMRCRLSSEFGPLRGRGLIIPFKIAGTNEPHDYIITSTTQFNKSKLLKNNHEAAMGFTGVGIAPLTNSFDLTITTKEKFDALTVYFSGDNLELMSATDSTNVAFTTSLDEDGLWIEFSEAHSNITLNFYAPIGTSIHGISAECGCSGLAYHVIGNNGAQYASYDGIDRIGQSIAALSPDLIIISLGTNEAFGRFSSSEFRRQLDSFVSKIIRTNPGAKLLLTTPSECQRRKRRRRRTYYVNSNIEPARDVIIEYANQKHIPVYDWYEVAGGKGSSSKWVKDRTLSTDRIHLTAGGYQLQGDLFSDALIEVLNLQSNIVQR